MNSPRKQHDPKGEHPLQHLVLQQPKGHVTLRHFLNSFLVMCTMVWYKQDLECQ